MAAPLHQHATIHRQRFERVTGRQTGVDVPMHVTTNSHTTCPSSDATLSGHHTRTALRHVYFLSQASSQLGDLLREVQTQLTLLSLQRGNRPAQFFAPIVV